LVLYVEAKYGDAEFVVRLREHLRQALPPQLVPQHIELVAALPQTASGKIDRGALPPPAGLGATPAVHEPRIERIHDGTAALLVDIWRELLKVDAIGVDDDFFDRGGDSLLGVELFHRIQQRTGVNLPLATLLTASTVAAQARAIAAARPQAAAPAEKDHWSPLVAIQPQGSRPPLFCIHALGGNVLNYMPVAQALGADQPCFGLQAPGLDGVTPPLRSIEQMASRYRQEIRVQAPHGPYYLCGGSMGGLIAFEIAQQLMTEGESVAFLGLFDTYGPGNSEFELERPGSLGRLRHRWSDRWQRARKLDMAGRWQMLSGALTRRIARVRDALLAHWYARRGLALPHALRYRQIERVHLKANDTYVPLPYHGAITLFRASEQPDELAGGPTLGWDSVAKAGIRVVDLPGTHDTLIEQPELAVSLRDELALAQRQAFVPRALRLAK
jgi:thioesterase domain-containing protein